MTTRRFDSIDILRGLVMVLMAIDHTRDYFHADSFLFSPTDLEATTASIFFTRWITHYCAPVFVFLAGTSAYMVQKRKGKDYASRFLFTRGIWLIFLEMTIVSLGWSFAINAGGFMQVIWAIGLSMVMLSIISRLPAILILMLGLLIVFGHNALDGLTFQAGSIEESFWNVLHTGGALSFGPLSYYFAYPVLPWFGVMFLGFVFGKLYTDENLAMHRKKWLLGMGLGSIALFVLLRVPNIYGNPSDWEQQDSTLFNLLAILNVHKYPPSLQYMLMTLGPAFLFLALTEHFRGRVANFFLVFGRVPLFYYILHLYLIHALAILHVMFFFPDHSWKMMLIDDWGAFNKSALGYGFGLIGVYIVTALVVAILYPVCKWYGAYKARHPEKWWLSYM
jgi:uncharacterized membrane protein